jgi:hypothetical protein
MDKELDDLLDSALDDFDKKVQINDESTTPKSSQSSTTVNITETVTTKGNVTIEKMNLYVDDIDYDDRPARSTSSKLFANATASSASKPAAAASSSKPANAGEFNLMDDNMKLFEEIFNDEKTKSSMKQFKDMIDMFKNEEDEGKLMENFQKVMSELATDDLGEGDEDDADLTNLNEFDFLKNFTNTMQGMNKNSEKEDDEEGAAGVQDDTTEKKSTLNKVLDDMNKNTEKVFKNNPAGFPFGDFLSQLNQTGGDDDDGSGSMMEPILSMLFSKDILYPSLKMMLDNYDKYVSDRKEKLSEEELKKCLDQKECIKEMCAIYESQKETDSGEVKAEQLKSILDLLEKCGVSLF